MASSVVVLGAQANITLLNCKVEELAPDGVWFRVSLLPDVKGEKVNIWLPDDTRISVATTVPANWPPIEGDVWRLHNTAITAWVVNDGAGHLYFVTEDNIRTQTVPITTNDALAAYGTSLELVTRLPAV